MSVIGESNETRIALGALKKVLDLVVQYEHERTTGTTKDIGECALEEGTTTLRLINSGPAVKSAFVQNITLSTTRLHHHTPTYRIKWIRYNASNSGYSLKEYKED